MQVTENYNNRTVTTNKINLSILFLCPHTIFTYPKTRKTLEFDNFLNNCSNEIVWNLHIIVCF